MNIAVFVSGNGSNLQQIIDKINDQTILNTTLECVVSDRDCYALERALDTDIPAYLIDRKSPNQWQDTQEILLEHAVDFIVLAGYLSIIPKDFIAFWPNKIINIHPSLLPKYGGKGMYGMQVHQSVIKNQESESGATVHFVTEGIDQGAIILQKTVKLTPSDTPESCAKKVHEIEYELLPKAIQLLVNK